MAASSGEGKGSTLTVTLPLPGERFPGENLVKGPESQAQDEQLRKGARRKILVADDNRDGSYTLAMMLELMGNEVRTANDGLDAVQLAESFLPDVILMDVGMPRLNGLDATRQIRAQPWGKRVTIIALTGWGQHEDSERSYQAGCNRHLVKPVNPPDLEQTLDECAPKDPDPK